MEAEETERRSTDWRETLKRNENGGKLTENQRRGKIN